MEPPHAPHPFDRAILLEKRDGDLFAGRTDPAYANMVGPFGGITAATLLNAVLRHPARLGDPVALTVNFAGPVADGGFEIRAMPVRTNRSTQHWNITLMQDDAVVTTATAVFALRRDTWTATDAGRPDVPPWTEVPRLRPGQAAPAWFGNYDMRFMKGGLPDPSVPPADMDSVTTLWMRDDPPRPLDFASLTALCDAFAPRILVRRGYRVPAGTVSMTVFFHADARLLAAQGERPLLGHARASHFGRGYHDQSAEVWSEDGTLLATTHQVVYFKE